MWPFSKKASQRREIIDSATESAKASVVELSEAIKKRRERDRRMADALVVARTKKGVDQ